MDKLPTPAELGFPAKFDDWRAPQADAIRWLLNSNKRIKVLCAPTGFGKTPAYMGYAVMSGLTTCIVTDNRALQDQLMADFESVGLVDLRGRSNYRCDLREGYTCEDGYAARCPSKGTVNCPATFAEMRAASSRLVVTNYSKWTAAKKFGQGMSHFSQVIFDEGHTAPDAVADAMQVVLYARETEETLRLDFPSPDYAEDFINWKDWLVDAKAEADNQMAQAQALMRVEAIPRPSVVKGYLHIKNLIRRLNILATARPDNWVSDRLENGYQFDPVRVGRYTEGALFMNLPSVIVVSATLQPKTMYMLGVKREAFDYKEYPSEFDPKRCPIYFIPTLRVDSRTADLSPLWLKLDQFAAKRTDRKGIVHTISYARRDEVLRQSLYARNMIINERGEPSVGTVQAFKHSGPGTILVSPSVGAGFDFPLTECEWQFICKVPFPHTNKIIRARSEDDKEYPYYIAINKLQQICGRGMRSKADQCETAIVDEHLEWFYKRYGHLASKWFHTFFKRVSTVPAPLPKL